MNITAITLQVRVSDGDAGLAYYTKLIGRPPELNTAPDFYEWELMPDYWLQVAKGAPPMQGRLRFGVSDIAAERDRLQRVLDMSISEVEALPGVSAWCNFSDPWGNQLGLFQDLVIHPM